MNPEMKKLPLGSPEDGANGLSSEELLVEHEVLLEEVEGDLRALKRRTEPPSFWAELLLALRISHAKQVSRGYARR